MKEMRDGSETEASRGARLLTLRARAEGIVDRELSILGGGNFTEQELTGMLHDLRVYQIELEMQNEELQRSRQESDAIRAMYHQLFDQAPVGFVLVNERGVILKANCTMATMMGVERGLLVKKGLLTFIAPQHHGMYLARFPAFFAKPEDKHLALQLVSASGGSFWGRITGHRLDGVKFLGDEFAEAAWLLVGVTDISEQARLHDKLKKSHEQLRRAKETWEQTFDAIDEIITIQDRESRILQANRASASLLAMEREDLIGRRCYEVYRKQDSPCEDCPARLVFVGGDSQQLEIYNKCLRKSLLVSIAPLTDAQGNITRIVHTARDITDFRRLEQQLRQAQKMEAIGTLAGGIAHDFNNILTPILGYSELLAGMFPSDSKEAGMLRDIVKASQRAKELVGQILTFSHQGEQERRPVLMHLVVKEALKLLRSSIPSSIAIRQHIADCGSVLSDPVQIHQVLMNLCTNAYHAMRENGGELCVGLSVIEIGEHDVRIPTGLSSGLHVKLSIRDTGPGIPAELLERIFEPYFTTKDRGEGTGLGLAVVHGIVSSHNGHIDVISELGVGTEFQVYLPRLGGKEISGAGLSGEAAVPPPPGPREIFLFLWWMIRRRWARSWRPCCENWGIAWSVALLGQMRWKPSGEREGVSIWFSPISPCRA